jgi:DNA methylase
MDGSSAPLVALSEAEQRLMAPDLTLREARTIRAQAETLRRYIKSIGAGLKNQNQAALIKILAEWRAGELLRKVERVQKRQAGGEGILSMLERMHIPLVTGHRWQLLSTLPQAEIRRTHAAFNEEERELTSAALYLRLSRQEHETAMKTVFQEVIATEGGNLYGGDFRDGYMDVLTPASAQLVLTDPPYDKAAVALIADIAKASAYVLRPGGSLLMYGGQKYLGDAIAAAAGHLRYWWTFSLAHAGPTQLLQKLGIRCQWKPILWFVKETRGDVSNIVPDVVDGSGREKDRHPWQQGEAEAATLIEQFTTQQGLVVDFCAGSGTALVAAKTLGRRFAGFEAHADHLEEIKRRLA